MAYFLDTYVLVEMARGNPSVARYLQARAVTSPLNLAELCYVGDRLGLLAGAREICRQLNGRLLQEIPLEVVYEAAELRRQKRDSRGNTFSYIDAITYTLARHLGHTFVSSPEFSHLPGVEVV